jgi:CHRD domain
MQGRQSHLMLIWSSREVGTRHAARITPLRMTDEQFFAGEWYINVHTQDHQAGEIRGQVMPPKS